jgi:hypothetical protein
MSFGDLSNTLTTLTVLLDGEVVQYQRSSADALAFKAGAPHAGAHPLDDQTAFKLSDGADDYDDGAAQRAASVDIFSEADELHFQAIQIVEYFKEVPSGAGDTIAGPDQHGIEAAAASVSHHLIQSRPARFSAGDPVRILLHNFIATLSGELAQVV